MAHSTTSPLITTYRAARILGVTTRTVRNRIESGKAVRSETGRFRLREKDVARMAKRGGR
jgi:hypothetical protein